MINRSEPVQQNQYKLVIYTRNTSWDQTEGYRVHQNVQVLKDKCEWAGYEVSRVYSEPSTISPNKVRPVLKQMLKDAASGLFGVVVVWDVFTLTADGDELRQIERELTRHDVELCSATEHFDASTEEGLRVFDYMCKLLNTRHLKLAAMQGIPLSQVARWKIENNGYEGGETNVKTCETAQRRV